MKNEIKNNSILAGVLVALTLAATSLGMGIANNLQASAPLYQGPLIGLFKVEANPAPNPTDKAIEKLQDAVDKYNEVGTGAYRGSADQVATHLDRVLDRLCTADSVRFERVCLKLAAINELVTSLNSDDLKALTLGDLLSGANPDHLFGGNIPLDVSFRVIPRAPFLEVNN